MHAFSTLLFASETASSSRDDLLGMAILAAIGLMCLLPAIWDKLCRKPCVDKSLWLTCPYCRELAAPIAKTKDRYRCRNCSSQFAGAPH